MAWASVILLLGCGSTTDAGRAEAEQTVTIAGDSVTCPMCTFSADTVVVLRGGDAAQLTGASRVAWVAAADRFVVAPLLEVARFAVFAPDGRLLEVRGSSGDGPGELRAIRTVVAFSGDTIGLVGEDGRLVLESLSAREPLSRSELLGFSVNDLVSLPNGWLAVNGIASGSGLVTYRRLGGTGDHIASQPLVPSVRDGVSNRPKRQLRSLAVAEGTAVWAVTNQYRIELTRWDTMGGPLRTVHRLASWFPPYDEAAEERQRGLMPSQVQRLPVINSISLDHSGRLWVLGTVTAEDWQEADPPIPGYLQYLGTDGSPRLRHREWDRFLDGVIEVIDPTEGVVVARGTWPTGFTGFLAPGLVANLVVPESEAPEYHIFRLVLAVR